MSVKHTDARKVTHVMVEAAPRSGQTATGYGRKLPQPYMVKYDGKWHRVYAMCYGNSASNYIVKGGEELFLDIDTEHWLSEIR